VSRYGSRKRAACDPENERKRCMKHVQANIGSMYLIVSERKLSPLGLVRLKLVR
jgi:hypothetical protein